MFSLEVLSFYSSFLHPSLVHLYYFYHQFRPAKLRGIRQN